MGNYEQALADYSKAIKLDPTADRPVLNRALLFQELGQSDEAIADFEKFLEISSDEEVKRLVQQELDKLKDK